MSKSKFFTILKNLYLEQVIDNIVRERGWGACLPKVEQYATFDIETTSKKVRYLADNRQGVIRKVTLCLSSAGELALLIPYEGLGAAIIIEGENGQTRLVLGSKLEEHVDERGGVDKSKDKIVMDICDFIQSVTQE